MYVLFSLIFFFYFVSIKLLSLVYIFILSPPAFSKLIPAFFCINSFHNVCYYYNPIYLFFFKDLYRFFIISFLFLFFFYPANSFILFTFFISTGLFILFNCFFFLNNLFYSIFCLFLYFNILLYIYLLVCLFILICF